MKVAVFADIHSNYLVFKKAFEETKTMNVDKYIFLGDHITDGFDNNKVLEIIKNSKGYVVNGNREVSIIEYHRNKNEDWHKYINLYSMLYCYESLSAENIRFIESLDIFKIINLDDKKICLAHSTPYNVKSDVFEDSYEVFDNLIKDFDCDIYLFGHEHKCYHTIYKNRHFINPGTIGIPTCGLPYNYGILSIEEGKIEFKHMNVEYDYEELHSYYTSSDYYTAAKAWCDLLLAVMKDGEDHPSNLINTIIKKAGEKNIDVSKNIPNELFMETYEEYMKNINK